MPAMPKQNENKREKRNSTETETVTENTHILVLLPSFANSLSR
jgi:hypothetical protein